MDDYIDFRDPPPNRAGKCDGEKEQHLTEAAVMIAFATYLLENGAATVEVHPDGEHGKRHDIKTTLERLGFEFLSPNGTTAYGGIYRRGEQTVAVTRHLAKETLSREIAGQLVVAECKGGIQAQTSTTGQGFQATARFMWKRNKLADGTTAQRRAAHCGRACNRRDAKTSESNGAQSISPWNRDRHCGRLRSSLPREMISAGLAFTQVAPAKAAADVRTQFH